MRIFAVVTEDVRLVRKYERVQVSSLDMTLLARRLASPGPQHKDKIKPALREDITGVKVNDTAPVLDHWLHSINQLVIV